jgi:thiosulfate/3-mercaptopyruvate sulfurtransferase
MASPFPGPLVDATWLRAALRNPANRIVVADSRWYPDRPRKDGYLQAHIPGAVYVDVDTDLAAPVRDDRVGGRHPLPDPNDFAEAMSRVGIGDDTPVVVYDDTRGSTSARLWWMLHVLGHPVAMLDGGLQTWAGPLESGEGRTPGRAAFTPRPWPRDAIVGVEDVERLRTDPDTVIVDVRAAERYRGETEPIDPVAGHIPGAHSVPWTDIVDRATGRFRSADELRARYAEAGLRPGSDRRHAIAQCGSGVTACHALLAFELAGIDGARLYPGSWSDWISDASRPVATGPDPAA